MSKQKRPDTYSKETPEIPKHLSKRKKKPKKKRPAPREFACPFCEYPFKLSRWCATYWSSQHPRNFKCMNCGAGPWGYIRKEGTIPGWLYEHDVWIPEYCTFCNTGANFVNSKEHYFMLWTSPEDDVYCDRCKFRGKIGGKRK